MGTGREVDAFEMQVIVKALTSVFIIESDHSQEEGHVKIRIRLIKCCVLEVQTGERLRQEWANVGHTKGQVAGTWGSLGRG